LQNPTKCRPRLLRESGSYRAPPGVEARALEGVPVWIFGLAKTLTDCFKHRNSVGTDVAVEALKRSLATRKLGPTDLYPFATINRVWRVMEP
jgi:hypothetical protein